MTLPLTDSCCAAAGSIVLFCLGPHVLLFLAGTNVLPCRKQYCIVPLWAPCIACWQTRIAVPENHIVLHCRRQYCICCLREYIAQRDSHLVLPCRRQYCSVPFWATRDALLLSRMYCVAWKHYCMVLPQAALYGFGRYVLTLRLASLYCSA